MKFSIITPTYNRAFVIERAIRSVLAQKYGNWELVVVDDGSTDNTREVMEKYLVNPKIRYIAYGANKGVNYARNRGLENCTGDIITFLDSDDEFLPYTLEKAAEYISQYSGGYDVFCFSTRTEKGAAASFLKKDSFTPLYHEILGDETPGDYLFVVKRQVFEKIRFDESLNAFEVITWLGIAEKHKCIFFSEVLLIYWQDTDSILRNKILSPAKIDNYIWGNIEYLKLFENKALKKTMPIRKEQSKALSRLGYYYMISGKGREGASSTFRALMVYPLQLRAWRNLLRLIANFIRLH